MEVKETVQVDAPETISAVNAFYMLKNLPIPIEFGISAEKLESNVKSTVELEPQKPGTQKATQYLAWTNDLEQKLALTLMFKNSSWIEHHRVKQYQSEKFTHLLNWVITDGPNDIVSKTNEEIKKRKLTVSLQLQEVLNLVKDGKAIVDEIRDLTKRQAALEKQIEFKEALEGLELVKNELKIVELINEGEGEISPEDQVKLAELTTDKTELEDKITRFAGEGITEVKDIALDRVTYSLVDRQTDFDVEELKGKLEDNKSATRESFLRGVESIGRILIELRELYTIVFRHTKNVSTVVLRPVDLKEVKDFLDIGEQLIEGKTANDDADDKIRASIEKLRQSYTSYLDALPPESVKQTLRDLISSTASGSESVEVSEVMTLKLIQSVTNGLDAPYDPRTIRNFKDLVVQHALEHLTVYINAGVQSSVKKLNDRIQDGLRKSATTQNSSIQPLLLGELLTSTSTDFRELLLTADENTYIALLILVIETTVKSSDTERILSHFTNSVKEFLSDIYPKIEFAFNGFDPNNPYAGNVTRFVTRLKSLFAFFNDNPMMMSLPGYKWPHIATEDEQYMQTLRECQMFFLDKSANVTAKSKFVETRQRELANLKVATGTFLPELFLEIPNPMVVTNSMFAIERPESITPFLRHSYASLSDKILTRSGNRYDQMRLAKDVVSLFVGELVSQFLRVYLDSISIK
jgi:hypothetical protein